MQPERAIVLAAGLGLRMRPLTETMPKPLVPVAGKPLVDHALDFLQSAGIAEIVVNTSYKAEMLEAHLRTRSKPHIHISREESPLETGGGIREALRELGENPFIAYNSDIICVNTASHAVQRLATAWSDSRADAVLLLHPVSRAVGYDGKGDFYLNADGSVQRRGERGSAPYVFAGVQLVHPRLFAGCPESGAFSMNLLYDRSRTEDGTLTRILGLVHDGDWLHVGDIAGLEKANDYFSASRTAFMPRKS